MPRNLIDAENRVVPQYQVSGGWSAYGKMSFANPDREVSLQQSKLSRADQHIVQLALTRPEIDITAIVVPVIFCEALIEWTVAGNKVTRRVSVNNGVTVAGAAEAVRVTITDRSSGVKDLFEYDVGILVTPGTRPGNRYPPQLVRFDYVQFLIGATLSVTRRVPQDAGVASVNVEATAAGTNVQMLCGLGTVLKSYVVPVPGGGLFVPLSPSTVSIRITAPALPSLVSLAFGIDG